MFRLNKKVYTSGELSAEEFKATTPPREFVDEYNEHRRGELLTSPD